jgi:hypothetical protein
MSLAEDLKPARVSLSGALSWLLPALVLASAVFFLAVARGDWLGSEPAMRSCRRVVALAGEDVLGLALGPILLGGFGLGFFTFAGRDLSTGARVRGLFVCLLALAACAMSLESFSERARGFSSSCEGLAGAQEAQFSQKDVFFVRPSDSAPSLRA